MFRGVDVRSARRREVAGGSAGSRREGASAPGRGGAARRPGRWIGLVCLAALLLVAGETRGTLSISILDRVRPTSSVPSLPGGSRERCEGIPQALILAKGGIVVAKALIRVAVIGVAKVIPDLASAAFARSLEPLTICRVDLASRSLHGCAPSGCGAPAPHDRPCVASSARA